MKSDVNTGKEQIDETEVSNSQKKHDSFNFFRRSSIDVYNWNQQEKNIGEWMRRADLQ